MASLNVPLQHDTYCLAVLSNPAIADPFIRYMLEPELAAALVDGLPQLVPTGMAGGDLSRGDFDLAYLYGLKSGGRLKIILEHKSSQDRRTPAQMSRYSTLALERPDAPGEEPAVILPVVLYHGKRKGWTLRCAWESFRTRGRRPRPLPGVFYLLWNLMKLDLDSLRLPRLVWAVVAALVGAFRKSARERLLDPILLALPDGQLLERQTLVYISSAWEIDHVELEARVKTLKPARAKEDIMGSSLLEMARSHEAIGEARGKAETLLKLLRLKFRRLPAAVPAQVSAASPAQLDSWLEAVLYAESLDDVFAA